MEKDQKTKPICKICGRSFSSGMSLGGHMRSHMVNKRAKKPKVHSSNLAFVDDDDDNDNGYDHKKRVMKLVINEKSTTKYETEIKCKVCGKEFPSVRSLCGHMRWHKVIRNHACRQCGKEFASMRALFGHMTHYSRKSRDLNESANRPSDSQGKVTGNSPSLYSSSSEDIDSDEIQQAAMILMMLSRGITQSGSSNLVLKGSEGTGSVCRFDILEKKKNKLNRRKRLGTWGSGSSFIFKKEEPERDCLDLFPRGDGKKAEIEVYDNRVDQDDDAENELSCFEIKNKKRKIVEPGNDFKVEKLECYENSVDIKRKGLKKKESHICWICFKVFQTRKGLGGHNKIHKTAVENKYQGSISTKQEVNKEDSVSDMKFCGETEREDNVDLAPKSWCLISDHKHEPLLISRCVY